MTATSDPQLWPLIAARHEAILATLRAGGSPQMTNVLYVAEPGPDDADSQAHAAGRRLVRISTRADRAKARYLRRDPRVALHVAGSDFWTWAVAEGHATLSAIAQAPGDAACQELLRLHTAFYGPPEHEDSFHAEMIADRRLVIWVRVQRVYGLIATDGRRPRHIDT